MDVTDEPSIVTGTPTDAPKKRPRAKRLGKFERRKNPRVRKPTARMGRILRLLSDYRMCSRSQIAELLSYEGYSANETRRLLTDLFHLGYVDKPEAQQRFQARLWQGTLPDMFALGDKGAEYLEAYFGIPRSSARWRDKNRTVKDPHIAHTLDTAEVMLAFERACILRGDVRIRYPRDIIADAPFAVQNLRKPFGFRVEPSWQGSKLKVAVNADYPFGLEFLEEPPGRNTVWFLLETDEGTETIRPEKIASDSPTNLFNKYLGYDAVRQKKLQTERFGWGSFRVITVTKKSGLQFSRHKESGKRLARTRVASLQEAAILAAPEAPPGFFLFADLTSLKEHDDVLRMPWKTADPARSAVLELKSAGERAAS